MLSLPLQNYSDATDPNQLRPGLEAEQVSPGLIGFLITFVMVAVVVALIVDMVRRQRRLRYRADYARSREQEQDEQGSDVVTPAAEAGLERGGGSTAAIAAHDAPPTSSRAQARDQARARREDAASEHEAPGERG